MEKSLSSTKTFWLLQVLSFLTFFGQGKYPHPLVFISGMKSHVLASVVDLIYFGEENVNKEDMEDFLAVSEELTLKGLGKKRKYTYKKDLLTSHDARVENLMIPISTS